MNFMKKLFVVFVLLLSLVGTATATDYIYILGDRSVYMTVTAASAGEPPVIVDCQSQNNQDPIGCIIAARMDKEKYAKRYLTAKHTFK
jgi:hypothetical protein